MRNLLTNQQITDYVVVVELLILLLLMMRNCYCYCTTTCTNLEYSSALLWCHLTDSIYTDIVIVVVNRRRNKSLCIILLFIPKGFFIMAKDERCIRPRVVKPSQCLSQ